MFQELVRVIALVSPRRVRMCRVRIFNPSNTKRRFFVTRTCDEKNVKFRKIRSVKCSTDFTPNVNLPNSPFLLKEFSAEFISFAVEILTIDCVDFWQKICRTQVSKLARFCEISDLYRVSLFSTICSKILRRGTMTKIRIDDIPPPLVSFQSVVHFYEYTIHGSVYMKN